MDVLSQTLTPGRESEQRLTVQNPAPNIPPMPDRGWMDWGIALAVCAYVGSKLLGLFTQQQSAESQLTQEIIKEVLSQNRLLLEAVIKRP